MMRHGEGYSKEDAVLHCEPDHPLHGHLLPHRPCLLPTLRQWREGGYSLEKGEWR
jgi:hypothetical protein